MGYWIFFVSSHVSLIGSFWNLFGRFWPAKMVIFCFLRNQIWRGWLEILVSGFCGSGKRIWVIFWRGMAYWSGFFEVGNEVTVICWVSIWNLDCFWQNHYAGSCILILFQGLRSLGLRNSRVVSWEFDFSFYLRVVINWTSPLGFYAFSLIRGPWICGRYWCIALKRSLFGLELLVLL